MANPEIETGANEERGQPGDTFNGLINTEIHAIAGFDRLTVKRKEMPAVEVFSQLIGHTQRLHGCEEPEHGKAVKHQEVNRLRLVFKILGGVHSFESKSDASGYS